MGSRGPIRTPSSIRGQREAKKAREHPTVTPPGPALERPGWLPEEVGPTWKRVLCDLRGAGVPLEHIDAHGVAMYCLCLREAAKAAAKGNLTRAARFGKDSIQWANQIGASPVARARLGIKPPRPAIEEDPWAKLDTEPTRGN